LPVFEIALHECYLLLLLGNGSRLALFGIYGRGLAVGFGGTPRKDCKARSMKELQAPGVWIWAMDETNGGGVLDPEYRLPENICGSDVSIRATSIASLI
jgi:hypothetical protein